MSVYYHPGKANVVVDALSTLSMGSVAHVEEERKELVKDVQRLARLGVCLIRMIRHTHIIILKELKPSPLAKIQLFLGKHIVKALKVSTSSVSISSVQTPLL